jgi:hypothetical protein
MKANRADRSNLNRQAIAGVQKLYATTPAIILNGVSFAPANIVKALQGPIDAADAANAAGAAFHKAVAVEKAAIVEADTVYAGLKAFVMGQFATSPETLAEFGFTPSTRRVPDTATVAGAVEKRAATRAARHTMGKRQKESVKGTAPAPTPSAPVAAPPVPAPTTVTSPAK